MKSGRKRSGRRKYLADGSVAEWFIQKEILSWLELTGLLHWRQNAGKIGHVRLGPNGVADIVIVVPPNGRFLGMEVKSSNGTLSDDQKLFRAQLIKAGGSYVVVRTLTQAKMAVMEAIGKKAICDAMNVR